MQMQVIDTTGKKAGKITLPDKIFAVKASPRLLAQAVRVYLSNQRQATVKVKRRGEVKGSGRKIWRQKGTGRARHGDRYAPIFVGGGIAHGPTGEEQYKLKLPKKMRRKALFAALTQRVEEKKFIVVDGLEEVKPKTKLMHQVLKKLTSGSPEKISIIISQNADSVIRGARNIKGVQFLSAKGLNAYEVLNSGTIIFMKDAVKVLEETFLGKSQKPIEPKKLTKERKSRKTMKSEPKAKKSEKKALKTQTKTTKKTTKKK
jgi:large subunit ribosomal protein L4